MVLKSLRVLNSCYRIGKTFALSDSSEMFGWKTVGLSGICVISTRSHVAEIMIPATWDITYKKFYVRMIFCVALQTIQQGSEYGHVIHELDEVERNVLVFHFSFAR